MAKFNVFARQFNGKVNFQISKGSHRPQSLKGFAQLGVVDAISVKKAEQMAQHRLSSGLFRLDSASKPKKIVIFVDYNGVLDNYENTRAIEDANPELERGDFLFLKATVLHEHVFKIAKLAIEHSALVVTTSDFRRDGINFYSLIRATVAVRGTEEQKAFVTNNRRELRKLCTDTTGVSRSRNEEITDYIDKEDVTHCVVLEDDHDIDNLYNRIWVSGYHGMSEKNFNQLNECLNGF